MTVIHSHNMTEISESFNCDLIHNIIFDIKLSLDVWSLEVVSACDV